MHFSWARDAENHEKNERKFGDKLLGKGLGSKYQIGWLGSMGHSPAKICWNSLGPV